MKILSILLLLLALASITGCFVRTGPTYASRRDGRSCPPAHHWDGYGCVHNGNGNGHGRGHDK